MRTRLRLTAVAVAILMLSACAGNSNPNVSPEGATAIKARAVVNAARAALPTIDAQMEAGKIPQAAGVQVLKGLRLVFVHAGSLANALDIVDKAKTATEGKAGADAAKAALASIDQSLKDGLSGLDKGLVTSILTLLSSLTTALDEVRAVLAVSPPAPAL